MRKKSPMAIVLLLLLAVFTMSMVATAEILPGPGKCLNCKKAGCPTGHCYVDCAGCCFYQLGTLYCYR
jgi:hypothetical protein